MAFYFQWQGKLPSSQCTRKPVGRCMINVKWQINKLKLSNWIITIISVKNHHTLEANRIEAALNIYNLNNFNKTLQNMKLQSIDSYFGSISEPCCKRAPIANHIELFRVNWFSKYSGSIMEKKIKFHSSIYMSLEIIFESKPSTQGNRFSHCAGDIRPKQKKQMDTVT